MLKRPLHALASIAGLALLSLIPVLAAAQTGGSTPPRVPPSNPPPICNLGSGALMQCPAGARADYYDPLNCPGVSQNRPGPLGLPSALCQSHDTPPIAAIACWDHGDGKYACEGAPLSAEGGLSYSWAVSSVLKIKSLTTLDPAAIVVKCENRWRPGSPSIGYLTLTVITANGLSGTATQPLNCES